MNSLAIQQADAAALVIPPATAQDVLAFELGWDHARFGVAPALPQAYESASLRGGLLAGRAGAWPPLWAAA
jgi:hypothetical protein